MTYNSKQFEADLMRDLKEEDDMNERLRSLNDDATPREARQAFAEMRGLKNWSSLVLKISFMENIAYVLTKKDILRGLRILGDVHDNYVKILQEYCEDAFDGQDLHSIRLAVRKCMLDYKLDVQTYNNLVGLRDELESDDEHTVITPKLVVDDQLFEKLLRAHAKKMKQNVKLVVIITEYSFWV